jgi:hypothetical protein
MALSKTSVLHYWSSRYGLNPRIGGRPVYTRNSAATFSSQEGELDTAIVNTPRFDWATLNLPNGLTERRKVLSLELARSNLVSADINSWTASSETVTGGQADPAGGTSAFLLTATGVSGAVYRAIGYASSATKGASVRLKAGSSPISYFGIFDDSAVVWRHLVFVTWTNGVPSLSTNIGAGTLFPVKALGGGWYEIEISATGVIFTNTNSLRIYADAGGTTGSVYAFRPQTEDGVFPTSSINGFSTTRATDTLYWKYAPVPQASMFYLRFIERGTILLAGVGVFQLGSAASANPRILIDAQGTGYRLFHNNGSTAVSAPLAQIPAVGDTVELLGILYADGHCELIGSVNGGAVASASDATAAALAGAWSDTKLYANGAGTANTGAGGYAEVKVVKYADVAAATAQGRMDELRALELGPNGDVL